VGRTSTTVEAHAKEEQGVWREPLWRRGGCGGGVVGVADAEEKWSAWRRGGHEGGAGASRYVARKWQGYGLGARAHLKRRIVVMGMMTSSTPIATDK
jgi:hypothetical protein